MSVFKDKQKTKDGRQWRFKVYYHNTEGQLVPYTSKRYLLEKEAKAEERVFILNRDIPVKKRFDIIGSDYFKDAYERLKEDTVISYESIYNTNIKPFFKNKYIDEISAVNIEKWKTKLIAKNLQVGTLNQCYSILNEIFKYANRKYELNYNPVQLSGRFQKKNENVIVNEDKIRYITYDQYCQLISVIDNKMWHCFFLTLYFTGMRKGEMTALTWRDIDLNNGKIIINKTASYHTKSGRYKITSTKNYLNREIVMSKKLKEELTDYKSFVKQYGDFSETWFVFGNGDILFPYHIDSRKETYFRRANLKEITIHEFRHSHVSLCINEYIKSGQTDSTKFFLMMSQRMGHSLRIMQETYMHLFPSVQDKIIDLLDNL